MNPVVDGWQVLQQHATSVMVVAASLLWGAFVIVGVMRRVAGSRCDGADLISLLAGAWMAPCLLASTFALLLGAIFGTQAIVQAAAVIGVLAAVWLIRPHGLWRVVANGDTLASANLVVMMLPILALVRLAFVKGLSLPLYFDSATHYGLIRQLLLRSAGSGQTAALVLPLPTYYHLGYHILLAGLIRTVHVDIADLMLVSGQMVLAAAPLPLYMLVHRSTGSRVAGLFAVVVGALGWYTPAHAVNWGKYPALFAILPMLGAIDLAYLAGDCGEDSKRRRVLLALAVFVAIAAFIIQTRTIIVLAMMLVSWMLASRWCMLPSLRRWLLVAAALLVMAALGEHISRDALLAQALDPYLRAGLGVTVLIGLLLIFAFRSSPQLAFGSLLTILLLLAGLVFPAPFPEAGTLLDRPLVEMLLWIPLSLAGAVGIPGLLAWVHPRRDRLGQAAGILIALAVVLHAFAAYSFTPSSCCSIVTADDLVALEWLKDYPSGNSQVAIASAQLRVAPAPYASLEAPVDAGVWIQPLAGLPTTTFPSGIDFADRGTLDLICDRGVKYVYLGSTGQGFAAGSLQGRLAWYRIRLQLPGASIYEVTACTS
jgi:hypothetical protein